MAGIASARAMTRGRVLQHGRERELDPEGTLHPRHQHHGQRGRPPSAKKSSVAPIGSRRRAPPGSAAVARSVVGARRDKVGWRRSRRRGGERGAVHLSVRRKRQRVEQNDPCRRHEIGELQRHRLPDASGCAAPPLCRRLCTILAAGRSGRDDICDEGFFSEASVSAAQTVSRTPGIAAMRLPLPSPRGSRGSSPGSRRVRSSSLPCCGSGRGLGYCRAVPRDAERGSGMKRFAVSAGRFR